ncbi:MAG TPA: peptide deformylase [Arachidicoccus soli]|uniref:Peptide deformylase n=1 Tax=Arachidicoccus soli TaxID=2341117 RepID=A0A386HQA6_9BACT|nr:peptide deformylase [Arachidicoccus soli]AYD48127.1 peptide deformylase [Arachidicoccus soli]HEU0226482.1 peptide deformylase [Arachidicoccus soli]
MILPIIAYGAPVLRKVAKDIDKDYPQLNKLIADMWETLQASNGVGLAAPQINRDIRLFLVDSSIIFENVEEGDEDEFPDAPGIKKVFINAKITHLEGEPWPYNEGCLSIPKIREDIMRPETVTIEYLDENFQQHKDTFNGITARVIQHEYDHIEGKLFIDYLKPLKKKLLQRKLNDISRGNIQVDYKMQFSK